MMKTAISIPDPVFRAADELARSLGLSRSELYARAVAALLQRHRSESVTERLNAIYADGEGTLEPLVARLQLRTLKSRSRR